MHGDSISSGSLHAEQARKFYRVGVSKAEVVRRLQIGRTFVRRILAK